MENEYIIQKVRELYEKYGVPSGFLDLLSDEEKIRGMKGVLAELDLKKKKDYSGEDIIIIRKIYALLC